MYLTQFFPENRPVVELCTRLLNYPTMQQYQNEERILVQRRLIAARSRIGHLLEAMRKTPCSTPEKIKELSQELGEYHKSNAFRNCQTMAGVVKANIEAELAPAGNR